MSSNDLVIIIGGGASGISIAHSLKHRIGHHHFLIIEQTSSIGGTWSEGLNDYPGKWSLSLLLITARLGLMHRAMPGCGVDIPSHFYSFSFHPNPDWSHTYCRHAELSRYMNDTVDTFGLRRHLVFNTTVTALKWEATGEKSEGSDGLWSVSTWNRVTKETQSYSARIVVSAVGFLSVPKDMHLTGLETFHGRFWHSARWDESYDWKKKAVAVIGNGCSATQIIPDMLRENVGSIVQFGRSKQHYMPRTDPAFGQVSKSLFRHIPFYLTLYRFYLFYITDAISITQENSVRGNKLGRKMEAKAINHIHQFAPPHLHDQLIPTSPIGCKRTVNDGTKNGSYLTALDHPHMTLVSSGAATVKGDEIISHDGQSFHVDAIIFANGFRTTDYLFPMTIRGLDGERLEDVWRRDEGAHAYKTISVSGFPNLALMTGPNSSPSSNSIIFCAEVQAEYISRILFKPILAERSCVSIDVSRQVEEQWYQAIRQRLTRMVWSTGCANWYLNQYGHNTVTFPECGLAYRRHLIDTRYGEYRVSGKNWKWKVYRFGDFFTYWPWAYLIALLCLLGDMAEKSFPLV